VGFQGVYAPWSLLLPLPPGVLFTGVVWHRAGPSGLVTRDRTRKVSLVVILGF
jgi:hypothetical protein